MSRFRERLKKKRLYKLLQESIKSGFKTKVIKPKSVECTVIDSRASMEPVFSPIKQHHRIGRSFLKGSAKELKQKDLFYTNGNPMIIHSLQK